MDPFALHTARLILNQPSDDDVDVITEFCTDPAFEKFMSTPWPYTRQHAESFVGDFVPRGWRNQTEWTWAIRETSESSLLGMISVRLGSGMLGFWLGKPHRRRGIMSEAATAAIDTAFERTRLDRILWECALGNNASLGVARKLGFRFTGQALGMVPTRSGETVPSWTAELRQDDSREPKPGWPI